MTIKIPEKMDYLINGKKEPYQYSTNSEQVTACFSNIYQNPQDDQPKNNQDPMDLNGANNQSACESNIYYNLQDDQPDKNNQDPMDLNGANNQSGQGKINNMYPNMKNIFLKHIRKLQLKFTPKLRNYINKSKKRNFRKANYQKLFNFIQLKQNLFQLFRNNCQQLNNLVNSSRMDQQTKRIYKQKSVNFREIFQKFYHQ